MNERLALLRSSIRDVPDFPKPGILFRDISPLLARPRAYRTCIELLVERYKERRIEHLVGIESRGFLFAGPLAQALGVPLHLVRKPGKLPWHTDSCSYELEYGESTLEIHRDALPQQGRVLIVDDVLATGGTAAAAARLVNRQGALAVEAAFVIELEALNGRAVAAPTPCFSLLLL